MMFPRLYLCGPMTGRPAFNYPAFNAAAVALRQVGFLVFSPTENGLPANAPWDHHMRVDLAELVRCHALATLQGTDGSTGAQLELQVARALGMRVAPWEAWIESARAFALLGPTPASQPHQPLGAST